jgi:cardiolipin synthase
MRARPEWRAVTGAHVTHLFRYLRGLFVIGVVLVTASCGKPSAATSPPQRPHTASLPTTSTAASPPSTASRRHRSSSTLPAKTRVKRAPRAATWMLVTEPDDGMQPIYALMSSARHELDMTMYELADPQAVDILEADAARGVEVRVILDKDYSGAYVNNAAYSELRSHGVEVHWAPADTIFHQKTITVDDHKSAVMSLNLTSEYYSSTRDFAVETTDHSDVAAIEQVFRTDWAGSGPPQAGPPGLNLLWSPGAEAPILGLIQSAQHSLLIENEEMADPDVTSALEAAARRGVDVEVVMTYSSSWAGSFRDLVAAGVRVRTYASDAALYIHAKAIVADGTRMFVGSQNFSDSSLNYNRELGIITSDRALVGPLGRTVASDFKGATPFGSAPATPPPASPQPGTTSPSAGAWCKASASASDDGYSGDYNVSVHSNQPDRKATASDAGDTYSYHTDSSGYAVIRLWNTTPGETIRVTVGGATCSTTA